MDAFSKYININNLNQQFTITFIWIFIFILLIFFIIYLLYLRNLPKRETTYMNDLYSLNGNIRPISSNEPDCSGNLVDYYIKTAYNCCSGGSYKNDYVSLDVLKSILRQGVRGLDFEIYSVNGEPVVATSTTNDFYVKETYNSIPFLKVMDLLQSYAFSGGTCPNSTDPLFIHLRIKSNQSNIYDKFAEIFKQYDNLMLGKEYSFENSGKNIGLTPLISFQKKIILAVDRSNTGFLENQDFLEYVNITSNSVFMRNYNYSDVKNNPDINELTEYNKRAMTLVTPDKNISNPTNPSAALCRAVGCQFIAMRYQYVDDYLMDNTLFYDKAGYAFVLKPAELRYKVVTIPTPTPQNPDYSYATRNVKTDYYNFNF